ncbi:hypothetical protein VUR80DRAFT_8095 [Thermomyces stellatus]
MSKRISFTTVTPLPASVSRQAAIACLHDHLSLIDLNPLVKSRHHLISPPAHALPSELHCTWYVITDRLVPGLPAPVSYTAAFQNLPNGVHTHAYAPAGRDTKEWWTIGGTLPGETPETVESGLDIPKEGLYLRHDVEARCNVLVAGFVKKTLKKVHTALVEHIVAEASADASRAPSPISPFRFFADDETFLGPRRELPSVEYNAKQDDIIDHATGPNAAFNPEYPTTNPPPPPITRPGSPPAVLRAPGPASAPTPPPAPTSNPPSPPSFLRPAKGNPCLKLSRAPSFPRMPRPEATTPVPADSAFPAPLRIPNRHSTALSFPSAADLSPDDLGSWSRDSLRPRPQSEMLSRNVSVVSKYPHAAEQDYSDIAAMNPFDSDDEGSDSAADTSFCESDGGGISTESPVTLVAEPAPRLPETIPKLDLRFDFDEHGHGLGISVPGEMMEEEYEVLKEKLPVLEDKRSSVRPPPQQMQATLSGHAC